MNWLPAVGDRVLATRTNNGTQAGRVDRLYQGQARVVFANGGYAYFEPKDLEPDRPCPCWAEVSLHDGHCCFRDATLDGRLPCEDAHGKAGVARHVAYVASRF